MAHKVIFQSFILGILVALALPAPTGAQSRTDPTWVRTNLQNLDLTKTFSLSFTPGERESVFYIYVVEPKGTRVWQSYYVGPKIGNAVRLLEWLNALPSPGRGIAGLAAGLSSLCSSTSNTNCFSFYSEVLTALAYFDYEVPAPGATCPGYASAFQGDLELTAKSAAADCVQAAKRTWIAKAPRLKVNSTALATDIISCIDLAVQKEKKLLIDVGATSCQRAASAFYCKLYQKETGEDCTLTIAPIASPPKAPTPAPKATTAPQPTIRPSPTVKAPPPAQPTTPASAVATARAELNKKFPRR